jgi:hypothetical protein
MVPMALLSRPEIRRSADFFALKNLSFLTEFKPENLSSSGKHCNHYGTEATSQIYEKHVKFCEISSSHGGEYDVQNCLLGCTAV